MSAQASLKPRKLREAWRNRPWYFWVPPELSDTGQRKRMYFASQAEAEYEAQQLKMRRKNFGTSLLHLTTERIHEASQAYEMLQELKLDLSLRECVKIAHTVTTQAAKSQTFGATIDEVLLRKARKSPAYQYAFKRLKRQFDYLADTLLCDVRAEDLEKFLVTQTPSNRNFALKHLRVVFQHGLRQGYLLHTPLKSIEFATLDPQETEVVSVSDVEKMLNDALANDLELVPYLVLGFYAGVRPTGELRRMQWQHIQLDATEDQVKLPAKISKTKKHNRWITLPPNAIEWLREYQRCGGQSSGPIVGLSHKPFEKRRQANRQRVGMTGDWPNSGMRHSFASYWMAMQPSAEKAIDGLVLMLGHRSAEMLFSHYYQTASRAEAEKFYAIRPPFKDLKIISMSGGQCS
jgi:integrase